ncbi:MAG TPA: polysaccharide deacetylase family protein, partial [Desulfatirhabdiaceae bacterium]|nr:polysaccharide deacetylase family protein [Desulfatirhabdiaceae bacterium]
MEDPAAIHILTSGKSPRLEYVAGFLSAALQTPFVVKQFSNAANATDDSYSCIIQYGDQPVPGACSIFAAGLLHETGIRDFEPEVIRHGDQTLLFPAPSGFDVPFDIFSAVFYLLSRYEEYLPFTPDGYGRFEAAQSHAFRHNYLEEPVVDQWLEILKTMLAGKYPDRIFPARVFRFVSTVDIDRPWAYLHRGFIRTAGGIIRDALRLEPAALLFRLQVLRGKHPDPYDTFEYIRQTEDKFGFRSLYFFLPGNYGGNDDNYAVGSPHFRELITRTASLATVGIHPSCKSTRNTRILEREFLRFSQLLGKKPEFSRQHFLLLHLPDTYRQLIKLGIQGDYSMGYASQPGFRAGTCSPFRFYDIPEEHATSLVVSPFAFMDVTLRQYLSLSPTEALDRLFRIIDRIKKVNGTFISLWHNESLSDRGVWKGWRI